MRHSDGLVKSRAEQDQSVELLRRFNRPTPVWTHRRDRLSGPGRRGTSTPSRVPGPPQVGDASPDFELLVWGVPPPPSPRAIRPRYPTSHIPPPGLVPRWKLQRPASPPERNDSGHHSPISIVSPWAGKPPRAIARAAVANARAGERAPHSPSSRRCQLFPCSSLLASTQTEGFDARASPPSNFGWESFAAMGLLALGDTASYPISVRQPAVSLHASPPRSVTLPQLRFPWVASTNSPEDLHLQANAHAGRSMGQDRGCARFTPSR
jgi:hypothetical protein